MNDADRFDLSLGTIELGWLPVSVVIDDHRFDIRASSVLNDPVFELAEAAEALADSDSVRSEVQLWLEPETINIRFGCAPQSELVRVSVNASRFIREQYDVPITEVVLDRNAVAVSLVRALRKLREQFAEDRPLRGWGSFPTQVFRAAVERLDKRDARR